MTFFAQNAEWLGYLTEVVVRKCVALSIAECSGCKDKMRSDLLHLHHQHSLLQTLQFYFEVIKVEMLNSMSKLYKAIEERLPHSEDKKKDMVIYCNLGKQFLLTCSPEALYYGRYVNETNDAFIDEVLVDSKKSKTKKRSVPT